MPQYEILFTIGEEGGMNGVKNMDLSMIKGKEAMVFDASGDIGKILTCGPGQIKIFATIIGKSSMRVLHRKRESVRSRSQRRESQR